MSITGSTYMGGKGLAYVTVDHDPTVTATDVAKGSLIEEAGTGALFIKTDDGATTNVKKLYDTAGNTYGRKTGLAHFFTGDLSTSSTTYVSATGRKGDFFYDPDQWSTDVIFRIQVGCKRDAGSTVTSAEFRIIKMNDDDTEGSVVGADPFVQITFSNDDVQKVVSGNLTPPAGKTIYRFQTKKTGGAGGEKINIVHFSVLAILPN